MNHSSGDHRRRDFSFLEAWLQLDNRTERTDDPMTAHTHSPFARPRHAGASRFAARWRAPIGAMGTGTCQMVDVARSKRDMRIDGQHGQPCDRTQQPMDVVTTGRPGEFGYRSLAAGHSGAGTGFGGDTP